MAYPSNFLRLVASGPLFTAESWSWGLSLVPGGEGAAVPRPAVPAAVVTAVRTFHEAVSGSQASLATIKLNEIGQDGKYVSNQTVLHEFEPPVKSGVAGYHAPQVALAISLDTGVRRGAAARGRFYIPDPRWAMGNDGRISTANATTIAAAATTMIEALHAALPNWRVGVASDIEDGAFREVSNVRVGRVLDTIRSRRTSLPEEHVVGATISGFAGGGGAF